MQQYLDLEKIVEKISRISLAKVLVAVGTSFLAATGVTMYMAHSLLPSSESLRRPTTRPQATQGQGLDLASKETLSPSQVDAILKRNIFNHEGELGDAPEEEEDLGPVAPGNKATKSDLPLKLIGVIFGGAPDNGLAMLENTEKNRVNSFIVGDVVMRQAKLVEIYDNKIILNRNGRREFIELEQFEITRSRRQKGSSSGPQPSNTGIAPIASGPPPEAFKEDGFERKGNDITLTESYKRNLLTGGNFTKVLQDAKAEPNMVGGELKGFRLTRIRENSIYQKAGFQNNDVVLEINGIPLRDAAGAIRLLQQLRDAKEVEVRVERGGETFNKTISIM